MRLFILPAFLLLLFACKTIPPSQPVSLNLLTNYIVKPDAVVNEEVNYLHFSNEVDFTQIFTLTRSLPGHVTVPDFNSQQVIAIVLKQTNSIVTVNFTKAVLLGDNLNVYYETAISPGSSYVHIPFSVAIVTKNDSIKRINFYKGTTKEKTIVL